MAAKREVVRVPVKLYDEVLEWINIQRKEHGLRGLRKIPDGISCNSTACPVANGLDRALTLVCPAGVYEGAVPTPVDAFIKTYVDAVVDDDTQVPVRVVRGLRSAA